MYVIFILARVPNFGASFGDFWNRITDGEKEEKSDDKW